MKKKRHVLFLLNVAMEILSRFSNMLLTLNFNNNNKKTWIVYGLPYCKCFELWHRNFKEWIFTSNFVSILLCDKKKYCDAHLNWGGYTYCIMEIYPIKKPRGIGFVSHAKEQTSQNGSKWKTIHRHWAWERDSQNLEAKCKPNQQVTKLGLCTTNCTPLTFTSSWSGGPHYIPPYPHTLAILGGSNSWWVHVNLGINKVPRCHLDFVHDLIFSI